MPDAFKPAAPVEVFFSYSHRDEALRDELEKHLSLLKRQGVITAWHDRKIGAGREWEGQIDGHLNSAVVILLLISADFLDSDYCYDVEMKRAMERHEAGEARVIPVILREVDWPGSAFGKLQALPTDARPITSWPNRDEGLACVARGIRAVLDEFAGPGSDDALSGCRTGEAVVRDPAATKPRLGMFDVFITYSRADAEWVEGLAERLEDDGGFHVWLDRWVLVPGQPWQQEMALGLEEAVCCAVCVGRDTPDGWFRQEIQKALNRQAKDASFRVIPVLLPDAQTVSVNDFLDLRTWVDFRADSDPDYAFHLLTCGIKGAPPGRWPPGPSSATIGFDEIEESLRFIRRLQQETLIDREVAVDYQRKILARLIDR